MYFVNLRIRKSTTIFDNSTKSCRNSVDPGGGEDVTAAAAASAAAVLMSSDSSRLRCQRCVCSKVTPKMDESRRVFGNFLNSNK